MKLFLFEFRTKFTSKKLKEEEEELLGSEIFYESLVDVEGNRGLLRRGRLRLDDYWMSEAQMIPLFTECNALAKRIAEDLVHEKERVIGVVVDLVVCTVQREAEAEDEAVNAGVQFGDAVLVANAED
ncbi:hypothetical protein C2S53_006977 [Perilla frutescens var. hirtella]|uniref:Uncharacterized protein n=1 Tax=Perilla frutescens var. hirtella TaxID=608512 RepID=A0AAD4P3E3_PERFH|nr:hypothetical protein C2S53_006977 [Perilla frutescens var. hirtella]